MLVAKHRVAVRLYKWSFFRGLKPINRTCDDVSLSLLHLQFVMSCMWIPRFVFCHLNTFY
jgi:hypothetical protein